MATQHFSPLGFFRCKTRELRAVTTSRLSAIADMYSRFGVHVYTGGVMQACCHMELGCTHIHTCIHTCNSSKKSSNMLGSVLFVSGREMGRDI